MGAQKIEELIEQYVRQLEDGERNEVYETLLLVLLNDDFHKTLVLTIEKNLQKKVQRGSKVNFEFSVTDEYVGVVNMVCQSKYFLDTFTKDDIERKRRIMMNIIPEIVMSDGADFHGKRISLVATANSAGMMTRDISYKEIKKGGSKKMAVIFSEGVSLDEVVKYLKDVVGLKNSPRKKKMSLGQSHKMLWVENKLKADKNSYKKEGKEYFAQAVAREMKKCFNEDISMENVAKSLQRIKKIKKEINVISDK